MTSTQNEAKTDPQGSSSPKHIQLDQESTTHQSDNQPSPGLRNAQGWDGKLRVDRPSITNPEALSDPDYSDEENVLQGNEIGADEDLLNDEPTDSEEILVIQSRVTSIAALRLERFTQCARLCFRQNQIQEIEGLSCLATTLQDLDLYDNLIGHMRGLDDLSELTNLDLSFNKIRHIRPLGHLKRLKELFLVANKISTIENLDGLDSLTGLELGSNRIREIQNLGSLQALEELWLAKNKITSLSGLAGLPHLRLLSIQSNRISDLSPLSTDVPTLEELYISHNALTSVRGLGGCKRLRILEVSNNEITSLDGLAGLNDLEELWASYNKIADFADVERELGGKKNLTTVYFEGNPLQLRGPALYRNKVKLALPQVSQIDATFVKT